MALKNDFFAHMKSIFKLEIKKNLSYQQFTFKIKLKQEYKNIHYKFKSKQMCLFTTSDSLTQKKSVASSSPLHFLGKCHSAWLDNLLNFREAESWGARAKDFFL